VCFILSFVLILWSKKQIKYTNFIALLSNFIHIHTACLTHPSCYRVKKFNQGSMNWELHEVVK